MMSRIFYTIVWHPGYTCKLAIRCSKQDLRSMRDFTLRIALVLFDHGVAPAVIDEIKSQQLYYTQHGTLVPVTVPFMIPPNSNILSKDASITCNDPLFFRIEVDQRTILPVRMPETPLLTLDSIKQYILRVLRRQYGVVCDTSTFHVHYAKWTLGTPSRRHFTHGVVRVYPVACRTARIHAAACCMQTKLLGAWKKNRQNHAAARIQARWRDHRSTRAVLLLQRAWHRWRDAEWTSIN